MCCPQQLTQFRVKINKIMVVKVPKLHQIGCLRQKLMENAFFFFLLLTNRLRFSELPRATQQFLALIVFVKGAQRLTKVKVTQQSKSRQIPWKS